MSECAGRIPRRARDLRGGEVRVGARGVGAERLGGERRRLPRIPRERLARGGSEEVREHGIPAVDLEGALRGDPPARSPASTSTSRSPRGHGIDGGEPAVDLEASVSIPLRR